MGIYERLTVGLKRVASYRKPVGRQLQSYDERLHHWIRTRIDADSVARRLQGYTIKFGIEWLYMGTLMFGLSTAIYLLHLYSVFQVPRMPNTLVVLWLTLTGISGGSAQCKVL